MASEPGGRFELLSQHPVFQDIDPEAGRILWHVYVKGRGDIVDELLDSLEEDIILETRQCLFSDAVSRYDELFEDQDTQSGINLVLIKRKGDNCKRRCATDVYELLVYVVGLHSSFPRDVLSSSSCFVELPTVVEVKPCYDMKVTELKRHNAIMAARLDDLTSKQRELEGIIVELKTNHRNDMSAALIRIESLEHSKQHKDASVDNGLLQTPKGAPTTTTQLQASESPPTGNTHEGITQSPTLSLTPAQRQTNHDDTNRSGGDTGNSMHGVTPSADENLNDESPDTRGNDTPSSEALNGNQMTWSTSFSEMTQREGPWTDVSHRRPKSPAKTKSLRGIKYERSCELYVQNIQKGSGISTSDIESLVKAHAECLGAHVSNAHVIKNRWRDDCVGCKIRVPFSEKAVLLGAQPWPDDIECREWESRPSQRMGAAFERGSETASEWRRPDDCPRRRHQDMDYRVTGKSSKDSRNTHRHKDTLHNGNQDNVYS